jgi:hypothetical protein
MAQQVSVEELKEEPLSVGIFPPTEGGTVSVKESATAEEKPVGKIPRQAAKPIGKEITLSPDPVLGVTVQTKSTGDVSQAAGESIAAQVSPSIDTMIETAQGSERMRLLALQEKAEAGDANAQMKILAMTESQVASGETVKTFTEDSKPMSRETLGTLFPSLDDPFAIDMATMIGQTQIKLDNMLRETVPDARVRQVLVENGLGSAGEVSGERMAEMGRGSVNIVSLLLGEGAFATPAYYAGLALTDWWTGKASSFSTAYASYAAEIKRDSEINLAQMESVVGRLGLSVTMGRKLDDFVKQQLKEKLDAGLISQEEYNETVFESVEGQLVEKTLVTEETAQNIQSLSMSELPYDERFAVIAFENLVGMVGFGAAKAAKGKKTVKQVQQLKQQFPELTEGLEDPAIILRTVQEAGKARNINKKFLEIGLKNQRVDNAVSRIANDIENLHDELSNMRLAGDSIKGSPRYANYISKKQEVNLLQTRLLKAKFTLRTIPFVAEGAENSLIISVGQLAARDFLPEYTGLDADTAEAIGAITMAMGGYKAARVLGQGFGSRALRLTDGNVSGTVASGFGRVMDFLTFAATGGEVGRGVNIPILRKYIEFKPKGKSLFGDETILLYEESIGRPLTQAERRGITYTARLIQNMDPEQRELVFKAQQQYLDLQERIVNKFPEGEARERAKELFSLSFAQGSALSPLAALNRLETAKMNVRDLKSMDANTLRKHTEQQERQIALTEESLDNFERLLEETGDMTGKQDVSNWILSARNAVSQHKIKLRGESEDHLAVLDELETAIFSDVTTEIPSDFFDTLLSTRKSLHTRIGKAFDEKAEILRLQSVFQEGLTKRIEIIKDMRGKGSNHRILLGNAAEDMIDTHIEALFAKGKAAYAGIVEFARTRPKIDMTPVVQKMVDDFGQMSKIENMFSAGGDFFNGKLGRQAQEVFQDMVDRVLPPEELAQMKEMLKANGIDPDALTDLEIAIRADRASNGGLRIFSQADPYEIEIMRRAVRDYAARLDPENNRDLRRIANNFKLDLDNLIKTQDKEMYERLEAARTTYQSEVGDRLRPGQKLTQLLHARKGPEVAERPQNAMFRFLYSGQLDPVTIYNPISEAMSAIAKGGRSGVRAKQTIRQKIDEMTIIFGDRVGGNAVFDLTTPEGKSKFNTIRAIMEENVYADWAEDTLRSIKQPRPTQKSIADSIGGYDFNRSTNFDELEDSATVSVILEKGGQPVEIPLVRTGEMISSEQDIVRLIAEEGSGIKKRYDEFVKDATTATSQLNRNVNNAIKNESEIFDALKPILDEADPNGFYNKIVFQGTEDAYDIMREQAVALLKRGGMSADEAADSFDAAAKNLVTRALMERGGLKPVSGRTITGLNMDKTVVRQFTTPEIMLQEIQDNRQVLDNIMGKQHVDYLQEITEFLNMSSLSEVGATSFEGLVRGYGTNEALSRVYNMARGMVSPLYVTSEFAVRLAASANIEMLQLAGQDMNAARIMTNMFKYPELIRREDMDYLNKVTVEFVLAEIAKRPTTYQQAASLPDLLGAAGKTTTPDKEEENQ